MPEGVRGRGLKLVEHPNPPAFPAISVALSKITAVFVDVSEVSSDDGPG